MERVIYADNAATTKLDTEAFEAMKPFLINDYANASQPYSFSRAAKAALRESREIIADCINANPEEIFFTSGGTESDNWALKGTMQCFEKSRKLITSQIEHHAVLSSCLSIEEIGYSVSYLPVDNVGIMAPNILLQNITDQVGLVSVMFSNNEVGSIQPIKELADISHRFGAIFHTDAVQAVGHIPINVKRLGVDMLSSSAHKFNGPKGIGFLYIKNGIKLKSLINGGAQEFGRRAGTENIASIVGMAAALKKNCDNIKQNSQYIRELENMLIAGIKGAGLSFIRNGSENHVPGNISLSFSKVDGEMLLHRLDLMGICVSTGSACDGNKSQMSHVLQAMNVPEEYARGTIRISLGHENTKAEVQTIINALTKILKAKL